MGRIIVITDAEANRVIGRTGRLSEDRSFLGLEPSVSNVLTPAGSFWIELRFRGATTGLIQYAFATRVRGSYRILYNEQDS